MAFDFPINPTSGQKYEGYTYDSATGTWVGGNTAPDLSSRISAIELRVPAGTLHQSALGIAPSGYLFCQGQAVSRTVYVNLFNAIGTTYGAGDGSTTFNIPDLQGRVPVGKSASGTFSTLNNKGGAETHTLTTTEMPSHTHIQNAHTHSQNNHSHQLPGDANNAAPQLSASEFSLGPAMQNSKTLYTSYTQATNQNTTATNQNAGSGSAHNNLQPYIVLNYIIKT